MFLPSGSAGGETTSGAHAEGAEGAAYGAWAVVVGMPDGRALRRLCREQGPWRTVPLRFTEAEEVAQAFWADDVALVVDGGRREGPSPTVVDATVTPIRVLREGALPASFIEGTMLMSTRRKLFSRTKKPAGLKPGAGDRAVRRAAGDPLDGRQGADRAPRLPVAAAPAGRRTAPGDPSGRRSPATGA